MRGLHIFITLVYLGISWGKEKPVKVSLDAKWRATPLLLESSEFMADEDLFADYVKKLHTTTDLSDIDRDDEMYHLVIKKSSELLPPSSIKLLEFALAMRLYSPKVTVHQQLATELNPSNCPVFAVVCIGLNCESSKVTCEASEVVAFVEAGKGGSSHIPLYQSDMTRCVADCAQTHGPAVILYGELGSKELKRFMSQEFGAYTVIRHYVKNQSDKKVRLSGYGVELAVKSTEYKAQDDSKREGDEKNEPVVGEVSGLNFTRLAERFPELRKELKEHMNALSDSSAELQPLKVWQTQDLSIQAAQKALTSDTESPLTQLSVLKDTTQNFPSLAASLAKVSVKSALRSSIKSMQKDLEKIGLMPGDSALYVNGVDMDVDSLDMFSMYDNLRQDLVIMEKLAKNGVANDDIGSLLNAITNDQERQFALDFRDSSIIFINDLESDDIYMRWPKNLQSLLQPTFPGMMRYIGRNLFNLVLMFDVKDPSIERKLSFIKTLYEHQTPIRLGFVPVSMEDDEAGQLLTRILYHLVDENENMQTLSTLIQFYEKMISDEITDFSVDDVKSFFSTFADDNLEEAMSDEEYAEAREKAAQFYRRSGLQELPQLLLNGAVLKNIGVDEIEETVVSEVLQNTPTYQRAVYHGQLTDGMDPMEWLMSQDHVMPRLNPRILSAKKKCLDMSTDLTLKSDPKTRVLHNMHYLVKKDHETVTGQTIIIVADLDSEEGRSMVYGGIKQMKASGKFRLGLIHNPSSMTDSTNGDLSIAKIVLVAMETLSLAEARSFVTKLMKEENVKDLKQEKKTLADLAVHGMDVEAFLAAMKNEHDMSIYRKYTENDLKMSPGQRGLISNGQLIGPLLEEEPFTQDDFMLLEKITPSKMMDNVLAAVAKQNLDGPQASNIASSVMGSLSCATSDKSRKDIGLSADSEAVIVLPPGGHGPAFDIIAVVEPVSRGAQKLLPILFTLQKVVNCNMKIFLNCKDKLSELPLKSFYRYVLEPEVKFNVVGELTSGPEAVFNILPHKSLLTMNVHPPEGWLVESVKAVHDLDNIKLEEVKGGVTAAYELEYILLEGHCYDAETGQPPRGLQIILGTNQSQDSAVVDTLVMANLGYFQLKANPGAWHLMLREGRSQDLYHISSHEHTDSPKDSPEVIILMDSFKSKIVSMKVKKNPGMEAEELLTDSSDEQENGGGLWDSFSSLTGSSDDDKDEYLNIFSLASGHLYERFLRIMILSVTKQASSPVKFWLLKNYLSPAFKEFIPVMAEKYGFKYELVQYKWPRWLNQQSEKQRVMWGYKILFLDVLFPLGVKKVAFIDADQTVRTDIKELFDLDLEGAPYGYTPFCSSRAEMDGFRFWKSGYWANHLGRRPYHISALYVIDLKKFRKIAAGDRLRGQYQALSQDPNSLSNLDQDLPNNMIHQVKIKSLPQEWLWCETWCSDESKPAAKTIDLCNNPKTKEPKLEAAKRIVPEWTGYDDEIKALWDSWEAHRPIETEVIADKHDEL